FSGAAKVLVLFPFLCILSCSSSGSAFQCHLLSLEDLWAQKRSKLTILCELTRFQGRFLPVNIHHGFLFLVQELFHLEPFSLSFSLSFPVSGLGDSIMYLVSCWLFFYCLSLFVLKCRWSSHICI
ncbi:hypothetical protein V8G54_021937, partial [Vigna mungo]